MRPQFVLAAGAALLTLNAGAHDVGTERVSVVGAQPKPVAMAPMAFDRVQGDYRLADGRVLSVTGKGVGKERKLYADLGDGPVEMVHVGKNRFVGAGKDVRISFDAAGGKHPESVRVSAPARG